MEASDQVLLRRWNRERDEEAFLALITRHAAMVYATSRRVLGNPTEAEDVAQECFETLATSGERHGAWLGAWLHRVATYRSLDRLRGERRRVQRETRYADIAADATMPAWNDLYTFVDEAIAELPEKLQAAVTAHFLEGQSFEAIAQSTGVSRQAAHYRIQKGIELMRESLKRRGIAIAAASLGVLLEVHAAEAAPPALISRLGKIALSAPGIPAASGLDVFFSHLTVARVAVSVVLIAVVLYATLRGNFDTQSPSKAEAILPSAPAAAEPIPRPQGESTLNTSAPPMIADDNHVTPVGRIHGLTVLADGTPAAGVRVAIAKHGPSREDSEVFHAETDSDTNGRFEFKNVPLEKSPSSMGSRFYEITAQYEIAASKGVLFGMISAYQKHEYRDQYVEVILYEDEPIAGMAVDDRGAPIAGATICADMASSGAPSFGPVRGSAKATTDDKGSFELRNLFPGAYSLTAEARGYVPAQTSRFPTGTRNVRVVFSSAGVVQLRGRVVEAVTRRPVAGVKMRAAGKGVLRDSEDPTGADGVFAITLAEGRYEVEPLTGLYFSSGTPLSVEIRDGVPPREALVEVVKGATIRGRVLNAAGRGATEICVCAKASLANPAGRGAQTITKSNGTFLIEGLDSGTYTLEALVEDWRASKPIEVIAGKSYDNIELVLAKSEPKGLRGRVIDGEGRPVPFASVYFSRPNTSTNLWKLADEEGRFDFLTFDTDDPSQNPAYVQAMTENALSAPVGPIARVIGAEITVRVQAAAQIDGVVKDHHGAGIPNAVIIAIPSAADGLNLMPLSVDARQSINNMNLDDVDGNRTTSFLQGRFTMWPLLPGAYTVCAFLPHSTATSPAASLPVTLTPGQTLSDVILVADTAGLGTVEGIVTRGDAPVRGQSVEAQAQTGRTAQMYAYTGPDGRYRIENVPPGEVSVRLHNTSNSQRENISDMQQVIALQPSETAQVDFPLAHGSGTVEGVVLINGRSESPVEVSFKLDDAPDSEEVRAECDGNGRYKAENLLPGQYSATMVRFEDIRTERPGIVQQNTIVVADNDRLRLDWRIETATLQVTVAGLQPNEEALVFLLPPDAQIPGQGPLSPETLHELEGQIIRQKRVATEFAFKDVTPGDYTVAAASGLAGMPIEQQHLETARYAFARITLHGKEETQVDLVLP